MSSSPKAVAKEPVAFANSKAFSSFKWKMYVFSFIIILLTAFAALNTTLSFSMISAIADSVVEMGKSTKFDDREPIIGFTGMRWNETNGTMNIFNLVKIWYMEAVEKAGGIPLGLPVLTNFSVERIRRQVEMVDAVIIQGGYDVTPGLYGEEPDMNVLTTMSWTTDIYLMEVIKQATYLKKPILGICRGMQMINVAFGGTLYQDLSYVGLPSKRHFQPTMNGCIMNHTIQITENTLFSNLFPGKKDMWINSFHHQAVKRVANGFIVDATSTDDGLVEVIHKADNDHWVLGTQFHPEMTCTCNDDFMPIFKEIVKQAKIRRNKNN